MKKNKPLTIGICGGSCTGKTTIVKRIISEFSNYYVAVLDQDSYYKDLRTLPPWEREKINFDHPDAFDMDLFISHFKTLTLGNSIKKPCYDFATHTRKETFATVSPSNVLLTEGILIYHYPTIVEMLDLKIFLEVDDETRLVRRIRRDIAERGRSLKSVTKQFYESVLPMHNQFVAPLKECADLVISIENFEKGVMQVIKYIKTYLKKS